MEDEKMEKLSSKPRKVLPSIIMPIIWGLGGLIGLLMVVKNTNKMPISPLGAGLICIGLLVAAVGMGLKKAWGAIAINITGILVIFFGFMADRLSLWILIFGLAVLLVTLWNNIQVVMNERKQAGNRALTMENRPEKHSEGQLESEGAKALWYKRPKWMISGAGIIVIVLIGLMFSPSSSAVDTSHFITYQSNAKPGFTISYPSTWIKEVRKNDVYLLSSDKEPFDQIVSFTAGARNDKKQSTLEEKATEIVQYMAGHANPKILYKKETTWLGQKAYEIGFSANDNVFDPNGKDAQGKVMVTIKEGTLLYIIEDGSKKAFEKNEKLLDAIASSVTLSSKADVVVEQPKAVPAVTNNATQTIKPNAIYGTWEGRNDTHGMRLLLTVDEGYIVGHHYAARNDKKRVDGSDQTTITGKFTGQSPFIVNWKSGYGNGKGQAEITVIDDKTLHWRIISSEGEHYIPKEIDLKNSKS